MPRLITALFLAVFVGHASSMEPIQLLDGMASQPEDNIAERQLTLVIPDLGGDGRDLYVRFDNWASMDKPGWKQLRTWQQQRNLQPSHISKQKARIGNYQLTHLDSGWEITLEVSIQSPAQVGQPAMQEHYKLAGVLRPYDGETPQLRRTHADPPWRRRDFPLHGRWFSGTIRGTATRSQRKQTDVAIEHRMWLSEKPGRVAGGPWQSSGDSAVHLSSTDAGLRFDVQLPTTETDHSEGGMASIQYASAIRAAQANALRVHYSSPAQFPRAASISLMDGPSRWYTAHKSLPLIGKAHSVTIPLSGMELSAGFDRDYAIDPTDLRGLRIGIQTGDGLGPSWITIHSVEAIYDRNLPGNILQPPLAPVRVNADFQTLRSLNGISLIPNGLFGVHQVGAPRDKHRAALAESGIRSIRYLTHANFAQQGAPSRGTVLQLVNAIGTESAQHLVECWTGSLFDPPPWLKNDWQTTLNHWRSMGGAVAAQAWNPDQPNRSLKRFEVWNEPFMWGRHYNKGNQHLQDPGQPGHLPGPEVARRYAALFNAAAEGAAVVNPHLQLGGPSSTGFHHDDWRHLNAFVLPVVDATIEHLDFVAEHHYGGRGRQYAAEYMVFQSAVMARHRKRIPIWNTECNDLADEPGGWARDKNYIPGGASRKRFAYQISDILSHLRFGIDHTHGRAVHALWHGAFQKKGTARAFEMMNTLIGDTVISSSSDEHILTIASRNGESGCLFIFNDGPWQRLIELPPHLRAHITRIRTAGFQASKEDVILETDNPIAHAAIQSGGLALSALSALAIDYDLSAQAPPTTRHERVYFAQDTEQRGHLWWLSACEHIDLTLPENMQGNAHEVWFVAQDLQAADAEIIIDGRSYPLPASTTGPLRIQTLPLSLNELPQSIRIHAKAIGDGFRLGSLAVVTK